VYIYYSYTLLQSEEKVFTLPADLISAKECIKKKWRQYTMIALRHFVDVNSQSIQNQKTKKTQTLCMIGDYRPLTFVHGMQTLSALYLIITLPYIVS